jgi:hypothetical protein
MNTDSLEELLKIRIDNIISKWKFLENIYKEIEYKELFHRTELKHVNYIQDIKKELYMKLGALPVFVFLTDYFYKIEVPGAYHHADKGLLILFHIVSGLSIRKMNKYIPYATFFKIYKRFYVYYGKDLNLWIEKMSNKDMYCDNIIRIIYAKIKNPPKLKNVTCYLDGYDSRITYEDVNLNKERLYSFKFKNDGLRTQFIIDINKFILFSSNSEFCNDFTDGKMLENIKLEKILNSTDCLMIDGGYPLHLNNVIEAASSRGYDYTLDSFCFPFRKEANKDLTTTQISFNKQVGAFRSDIESFFADYTKIFQRFNKNNIVRITEKHIYNKQIKLCNILYNIMIAVKLYEINVVDNYLFSLWTEENFKFKNKYEEPEFELECNLYYKQEHINVRNKYQEDVLSNLIKNLNVTEDNDMIINHKINNSNIYEIETILSHRTLKNNRNKYLVKWKNYDETTWENEDNFFEKDCIEEYWKEYNSMID